MKNAAVNAAQIHARLLAANWLLIIVAAIAALAWASAAGLSVEPVSALLLAGVIGSTLTFGIYAQMYQRGAALVHGAHTFAISHAFLGLGMVMSYAAAANGNPLVDAQLQAIDVILGLNRDRYAEMIADHGWLKFILHWSYRSLVATSYIVLIALWAYRKYSRLYLVTLAFTMSVVICSVASHVWPAIASGAAMHFLGPLAGKIDPAAAFVHIADVTALRDGQMKVINLRTVEGIITFPSFHTASGIILIWAFWAIRILRWPSLALNSLMIAATPVDGGHYFIDVFAGALVAAVSIATAVAMRRKLAAAMMRTGRVRSAAMPPKLGPNPSAP